MTIDTSDQRDVKALAAVQNFGQWAKVRDGAGRELAYGIPSATTEGLYHFANATSCLCPDSQYGHWCWHSRAVRLFIELNVRRSVPISRMPVTQRED